MGFKNFMISVGKAFDNASQKPSHAPSEYEFKIVKVEPNRRKMLKALNGLASQGWEPFNFEPKHWLEWGSKTTVTLRRKR